MREGHLFIEVIDVDEVSVGEVASLIQKAEELLEKVSRYAYTAGSRTYEYEILPNYRCCDLEPYVAKALKYSREAALKMARLGKQVEDATTALEYVIKAREHMGRGIRSALSNKSFKLYDDASMASDMLEAALIAIS